MNNSYPNSNIDSIGIDPTTINAIDTLDDTLLGPTNNNEPKDKEPKNKFVELLKKIIFIIVILAIMGGISFGLYYYLSLGNNNKNTNTAPVFVLNDIEVVVDTPLSSNILDYGDFSSLDLTDCTLNTKNVDNTKVGEYDYYVLCDNTKYTAKIKIVDEPRFVLNTKLVTKQVGETVTIKEFVETEENYAFVFEDEDKVNDYLKSEGGPYLIDIKVIDDEKHEQMISSVLLVYEKNPKFTMTCQSASNASAGNEGINYYIVDKINFNDNNENMNNSTRNYEYSYGEYQAYNNAKKTIKDGKITLNDINGYAVFSDKTMTINVILDLTQDTLDKEYGSTFPTTYADISKYYKTAKNYKCSL